jgi:hypothetical protein
LIGIPYTKLRQSQFLARWDFVGNEFWKKLSKHIGYQAPDFGENK